MSQRIFELNPKWYVKFAHLAYQNSLWIGTALLVLGLILDVFLIPTLFQRFGAVIVGYAVFHNIRLSDLRRRTESQKMVLQHFNSLSFLKNLPDIFQIEEMNDDEQNQFPQRLISAIQYIRSLKGNENLTPEQLTKNAMALMQGAILTKKANKEDVHSLKRLENNEIVLAVLGTLVWAFGDWFTNFFWHCGFHLVCT